MSKVVPFNQRSAPSAAVAMQRLRRISAEVETFVSRMQIESLTPGEMARILRIFDTANACIRIVLSDFSQEPAVHQLIEQSQGIKVLIEAARKRIEGLVVAPSQVCSA
ncbi:hypothetical protein [Bradyrhizobium guangzhouense]|uniref:Uncharacterized protein n=1 Tax=Bradyrhizobium guangzhouense TaxID=1325095 RepID=A0AAE5X5A1_9BRAD|nr:hypothetical protein [Bradyrhizobium guangzhouense]QAU48948.1 hypothetical protein XH91_28710 [Bradyrhizobium guangzhouense]RXH04727.1 hypothetical protein EAS56_36675 [Bradyrhizobium guangzhouense]